MSLKDTLVARITSDCSAEVSACRDAVAAYRKLHEELVATSVLPGYAARMIEYLRVTPLEDPTPARLLAHSGVMADLRAIVGNESVQRQAHKIACEQFCKIEAPMQALLLAAADSLDRAASELRAAEVEFFNRWGVSPERTAVSRTADDLRASINMQTVSTNIERMNGIGSVWIPDANIYDLEFLLQGGRE